jgi:hypothetical protein
MASDVAVPGKTSDTPAAPVSAEAATPAVATPAQAVVARPATPVAVRPAAPVVPAERVRGNGIAAPVAAAKPSASKAKPPVAKAAPAAKKPAAIKPVVAPVAKAATPKAEPARAVTSKPTAKRVQPADALRSITEQSLAQARSAFAKSQEATESFAKGIGSSGEVVQSGLKEMQARMTEAMEAQTQAAFGFFRAMSKVHSLSEAIDLHSGEMRRGVERTLGEAKEMSSLAQSIASKASEPVRKAFDDAMNAARSAH